MYTLADARREVADVVVPGGTCASGGFIDQRINSAIRRLMVAHDAPETQGLLTLVTDKDYVSLPRGTKTARAVNVCQVPRPYWSFSYSFSPAGPGERGNSSLPITLETAPGMFPTAFDHQPGTKLFAFSTSISDARRPLQIYGRKANGEDIIGGFPLPITPWKDGIEGEINLGNKVALEESVMSQPDLGLITGVTLPKGLLSYVTLLAIQPGAWNTYFLSKYHPEEIKPGYRRIYLRNLGCCPCNTGCCREITMLTKLDFIPLTRDDDILPVQSLDAIRFMVMAIAEEVQRNPQMSITYSQQAMAALNVHSRNESDGPQQVVTLKDDFGLSGVGDMYF